LRDCIPIITAWQSVINVKIDPSLTKISNLNDADLLRLKRVIEDKLKKKQLNSAILPPRAQIRLHPPNLTTKLPKRAAKKVSFLLLVEEPLTKLTAGEEEVYFLQCLN
jgi:hypothetical protein